ncbi:MAG: alpha/beta hydrolase fold domain-containing protein, partial [Planctomycetes bacterium]|nr:alpha/beta hydrolase fold domain-containing protein [Planctomycetota bacterium]
LMKRFFDRNDTDKDGFLDEAELRALAKRLSGRTGQQRQPQQKPQPQSAFEAIMERVPKGVKFEGDIAYRRGNDAWKLDLAMPAERGSKARPAIVFVHGGGWRSGDKRSNSFLNPILEFAAKGYVCITVNYRMLDEVKMPDIIADVKCAVRWLRAHAGKYNVDPDRIGAYGNSAGAHLVTMLGLCPTEAGLEGDGPWQEYSSMVQAVVASATPTGWVLSPERQKQSDERRKNRPATGNDTRSMPLKVKKQVSPTSYVSADVPPMLFVHDDSDSTVPVWHSDEFVEALNAAGAKDVTYMRYDNGSGHGVFGRNIAETGPAREAFFERTLIKKIGFQPGKERKINSQQTRNRPEKR